MKLTDTGLNLPQTLASNALSALEGLNALSARYGLALNPEAQKRLLGNETAALNEHGRIAFGGSVLPKLVYAFCDSPDIETEDYEAVLAALLDAFYAFKNESGDLVTDDELIANMRAHFDAFGGSVDALIGTPLETLCRFPHIEDCYGDE